MKLLTKANTKTLKGEKYGYLTFILHFAPANLSGFEVCAKRSDGCTSACLNLSGMGVFSNVQNARIAKTQFYFNQKLAFEKQLIKEINSAKKKAAKDGLKLAIRLNGTSDLPALAFKMARQFPDVQFYDYTKIVKTFNKVIPKNYHITFSRSESNAIEVMSVLEKGFNVAVVFASLPESYLGYKVVSGDDSDLRFLDEKNVIVGLTTKGKAKKDLSGFVVA